MLQMSKVQSTIPFKSRKLRYASNKCKEEKYHNENKDYNNTVDRALKRRKSSTQSDEGIIIVLYCFIQITKIIWTLLGYKGKCPCIWTKSYLNVKIFVTESCSPTKISRHLTDHNEFDHITSQTKR